uniref:Uncharacterized protein n=1 Tax=Setaria italica TaxID=4555 RepID=K3ZK99_SETIT
MGAPPFFWASATDATTDWSIAYTSLGGTQPPPPGPFPPPLPSILPPLLQQFAQNTGGMVGVGGPFGMMAGSMPPPPPLSLPAAQNQPQQQQSPQPPQQSPTSTGFFQSSSMGFFPPVQVRQSPSAQRQ